MVRNSYEQLSHYTRTVTSPNMDSHIPRLNFSFENGRPRLHHQPSELSDHATLKNIFFSHLPHYNIYHVNPWRQEGEHFIDVKSGGLILRAIPDKGKRRDCTKPKEGVPRQRLHKKIYTTLLHLRGNAYKM